VSNLGLDFQVVFSGSEAASITAFQQAEKNKDFLIGYFYEPQWLFADIPLQKVALPPYKEGCQDDPAKVACDYPETTLKKVVSTDWADKGSPAVDLVKNFEWTNDDQNQVAKYISEDGMAPEDAAAKWIADNQDKVDAWLS
jgi:glycine betaine/proline transport system substrate-binding protein